VITEEPLSPTEILVKFGATVTPEEIQELSNKIVPSPYKTVLIDISEVIHLNYLILGKLHLLKLNLSVRYKRLAIQGCTPKHMNLLKILQFNKTIEVLRPSPQQHQKEKDQTKWDDTL
jgi:anti-anti-sigma regulatory factor